MKINNRSLLSLININLDPGLRRGDPRKIVGTATKCHIMSYRRRPVSRLLDGCKIQNNSFNVKPNKGFTIIEVLISLSISAFIMLGLMQTYRSAVRYLEGTRSIMTDDRTIYLLFNQLERDFSTAYIPHLARIEKSEKDSSQQPNQQKQQTKEEKEAEEKKQAAQDAENERISFIAQIDEKTDALKIHNKKLTPFKLVSIVTTSPLQVYGEHKPRLVRIVYQLKPNKGSNPEQQSFTLERKETSELKNAFAKQDEEITIKDPLQGVTSHIIASTIKFFSIEYIYEKKEKGPNGKEAKVTAHSFTWGDSGKEGAHSVVPQWAEVNMQLWNDEYTSWSEQHITIPIFSYPTLTDKKTTTTSDAQQPNDSQNQSTQENQTTPTPLQNISNQGAQL